MLCITSNSQNFQLFVVLTTCVCSTMQTLSTAALCLCAGASICLLLVAARRLPSSFYHRKPIHKHDHTHTPTASPIDQTHSVLTEDYCLRWLQTNMPARDKGQLSEKQLRRHIRLALAARGASSWAAAVPVDLFLNDVLPYRSVDEQLDEQDWRPMFFASFMSLVAEADSLTEAAQILNKEIWALWDLRFVPDQTPEIMSVGQVLAKGFASCTGLSIFLVNACRAVGIPARLAGKWLQLCLQAGPAAAAVAAASAGHAAISTCQTTPACRK